MTLDIGPQEPRPSGLPEMGPADRVRAELSVLGLDVSHHVVSFYEPMLKSLGVTRSRDLMSCRSKQEIFVAGVKVATQTPPIRSGRRVVFLTLDDSTGPLDATFFEDAQGPYAVTLFHSWLLLVRGEVRRTGPRGVSLRATGCWELSDVHEAWSHGGPAAVRDLVATIPQGYEQVSDEATRAGAASRSSRPVMVVPGRRVLVHPSGFRQSPYADIKPAGQDPAVAPDPTPRKLWHSSPGSSGW
jgi:error-prone DNA polymerase